MTLFGCDTVDLPEVITDSLHGASAFWVRNPVNAVDVVDWEEVPSALGIFVPFSLKKEFIL